MDGWSKRAMSDCRRTSERLTPYVDDALPQAERADVQQHLERCPPCHRAATEEQGGRAVVRECADKLRTSPPLPPGLRSRCEALAQEHAGVRTVAGWRARLVPVGLMAVLIAFTGVALLSVATHRSEALLAAQLTADHLKCFKVFADTSAAVDAPAVEAHLASDYGWDMHVPPSSADTGLTLLGGRRCLYAEGLMPHVMYRAGTQTISLFRLDGTNREAMDITALGHRSRLWTSHGHTYVLVAHDSAPVPQFNRIARYVAAVAR